MKNSILFYLAALFALAACSDSEDHNITSSSGQEQEPIQGNLTAAIADGLHGSWSKGDRITLFHDGQTVLAETEQTGSTSPLSGALEGAFTEDNPLYGVYPAENAVSSDRESVAVTVPAV